MTTGENSANEVFISYSRRNQESDREVIEQLKLQEMNLWFDVDNIPKGLEWWSEIQRSVLEKICGDMKGHGFDLKMSCLQHEDRSVCQQDGTYNTATTMRCSFRRNLVCTTSWAASRKY